MSGGRNDGDLWDMLTLERKVFFMDVTKKLTLDVSRDGVQANVILVQGEVGSRSIAVSLRNGSVPLSFEKGITAAIHGIRPDGGELFNSCVVYTEAGVMPNTIVYHITEGTVAVSGSYTARLVVWNEKGDQLWSPELAFVVKENTAIKSAIGQQNEFTVLIEAVSRAETAVGAIDEHLAEQDAAVEERLTEQNESVEKALEEQSKEVDEALEGYVKRVKTSQQSVYTTDTEQASSGNPVPIYESVASNSIPRRGAGGQLKVGNPVDAQDAVNKAFLEEVVALLVAKNGNQAIDGNLSISGNLYVTGSTYGTDLESLNVKDAVIVANADGVPLAELSGYVIRVSDSHAYGILYDPVEDCVKIGLGTFDGEMFVYGANEAQVLATRDVIEHGNVPVWNGEKNTFEDSGKQADKLATEQYIDELYGDIDGSLSAILEEQKSILAIQDALIGGGV